MLNVVIIIMLLVPFSLEGWVLKYTLKVRFFCREKLLIWRSIWLPSKEKEVGEAICNNTTFPHTIRVYTSNQPPVDIINENDPINIKLGDVYIGYNCWIGANVFIKEGVKIGDFVVGANSVVSKDLPSNVIAAGAPIKILKKKVKI
jgi:NDP-sugar pyrophosphorylase family protein